jgi:hypothetical protein
VEFIEAQFQPGQQENNDTAAYAYAEAGDLDER